jgi:hypothetical protein
VGSAKSVLLSTCRYCVPQRNLLSDTRGGEMVSHSPWSQQAPDPKWGDSNPPIPIFLDFPHLSWNELFTPDAALLPIWRSCVRGGNLPLTKGGPRWPGNHLRIRKERHRSARAPMCAEHRDAVPLAVADHCDPAPASGLPLRPPCSSARGLATGASGKPLPPGTNKHRTRKGGNQSPFSSFLESPHLS